jgi:hypothetical protein
MRNILHRLTIIAAIIIAIASCSGPTPPMEKQAQFFAGVFLLQSTGDPYSAKTIGLFHELETLTGIDAAAAMKLLNSYREKPAQWQNLYTGITPLLTAAEKKFQTAVLKQETCPPAPLKGK